MKNIFHLDVIRMATPIQRFENYIRERYTIRERRLAGKPRAEWTRDSILATYKFTNVRRAWDYTSEWLTREWYTPRGQHRNAGYAAATARFLCYVPSLEAIKFPIGNFHTWANNAERLLTTRASMGLKVFTSAYMIVGGDTVGRSKLEWLFSDILHPAYASGLLDEPWHGSIDDLHASLSALKGWGDFMTQEVVLDLMSTFVLAHTSQDDRRWYGWAGPGAKRGLNRLAARDARKAMTRTTARDDMLALYSHILARQNIPQRLLDVLTVHDIEFSLCEFDKYERVLWGEGVPKQKFIPRSHHQEAFL